MNNELLKKTAVYLLVSAGVRHWEDAEINGVNDENGELTPFRNDERWEPKIRLEDGYIVDWPVGTTANIHFKVCDDGEYFLLNSDYEVIATWTGYYVPNDFLCFGDEGYGDYIIFSVNENGFIDGYKQAEIKPEQWELVDDFYELIASKKSISLDNSEENRLAFEAWYIEQLNKATGNRYTPDEMKEQLRDGDGYPDGDRFAYLRGCWDGWKARSKTLSPLKTTRIIAIADRIFEVDVDVDDTAVVFAREIEKAHGIGNKEEK